MDKGKSCERVHTIHYAVVATHNSVFFQPQFHGYSLKFKNTFHYDYAVGFRSTAAFLLAQELFLVEAKNIATQFFSLSDQTKFSVTA